MSGRYGSGSYDEETIYLMVTIGANKNDIIKCPLLEEDLGLNIEKIAIKAVDYARRDPKQNGMHMRIDTFLNTDYYKSKKYDKFLVYKKEGKNWDGVKKEDKLDMKEYLWVDKPEDVDNAFNRIDIKFPNPPRIGGRIWKL